MTRTERLYALVEELRTASPDAVSAAELANRLLVSTRTVERDITTLQEAGVLIKGVSGRNGGYILADTHALPPLHITPAEAAAMAVALARSPDGPLVDAGRSARRKLMAAMTAADPQSARHLANRLQALAGPNRAAVSSVLQDAIADHEVVELRVRGADGTMLTRTVEPVGLVSRHNVWYVLGWCRTADDHRSFRLDRIEEAIATGEQAPERHTDDLEGRTARLF